MRHAVAFIISVSLALGQSPAFEVASVKPAKPGETGGRLQFLPGGRFVVTNVALIYIVQNVYKLRDYQVVGDPRWMAIINDGYSARYNIEAKAADAATEDQMREMAKALLAERFQLKVHRETRDLSVYALIPAKNGIKLQPSKDDAKAGLGGAILLMDRGWIQGNRISMTSLVQMLSRSVDRPVVDQSGFPEPFDFRLTWTPDTGAASDATADGLCPASFAQGQERLGLKSQTWDCPSIFTAVQDQLGLKFEPQKSPTEVLVIDHVERPSEN